MNKRKSVRQILSVPLLLLSFGILFSSCGGKNDEPNPSIEKEEVLSVVDFRYEVSLNATSPVDLTLIATKGIEPNIYRDNKIVSQGNYSSDSERGVKTLRTALAHKGRAFVFGVLMYKTNDDHPNSISVDLTVKMYKNDKLIQTFKRTYIITDAENSAKAEFMMTGDKK